jgi:hypothetical protein
MPRKVKQADVTPEIQRDLTFNEKLKVVIDEARTMDAACFQYGAIRDNIFTTGVGIAWKLFKTIPERLSFCESKEFSEIQEIMERAQNDKMR